MLCEEGDPEGTYETGPKQVEGKIAQASQGPELC